MGKDNKKLRLEAMARGLAHVADSSKKLQEGDLEYTTGGLLSAARQYLAIEKGEKSVYRLNNEEVAKKALHHTSDFTILLDNVCNKFLLEGFDEVDNSTYMPFVRDKNVSDYKEISTARLASGGTLPRVNEHGEYKRATLEEVGANYRVEKFGEIIGVTEELLINDDLSSLTEVPRMMGAKIARTENETFWELISTPQAMADGLPLYHANHFNLGTPAALGEVALAEMRKLGRKQKDVAGKRLNIKMKYLVVPSDLEDTAIKLLSPIAAAEILNVNTHTNSLSLIVEPILDDTSTKAFFLMGDMSQGPMGVRARLNGQGPSITTRTTFDIDGMETKIKYSFGMRILDHRLFYKNDGL